MARPIRLECILCSFEASDFGPLAEHVKRKHGKEAREAYRKGKWELKVEEANLFSAVDAGLDAEGNKVLEYEPKVETPAPTTPPAPVVDVAQVEPAQPVPSGVVVVPPDTPPPSFIDPKADLIVGATGSGKTSNIGLVSDYIFAKYGKLTRMASTDPSGSGPLKGMVEAGQIEFWAVHAWERQIEAMEKSTLGYWPLRPGEPDSPLVAPDAGTWEVYGFGAYEGLTSYGDTILARLKETKASLSQDPSYSWTEGDFETSGGNQSYYGMMQDTLNLWVVNSHLLGYEKILWTALEAKGKDRDGNWVMGPLIGGKQAIGRAGQWFCNYVHMDVIVGKETIDPETKQKLIEAKHVLFLKTHIDPLTLVPFNCKLRSPVKYANEIPHYIASGSLVEAYQLLDKLYLKQAQETVGRMNEVKGLKEKLMERAAKAKAKEQADAEKRAKASGLLRPMVSVPAGVPVHSGGAVPATKVGVGAPAAVPTASPAPVPRPAVAAAVPASVPAVPAGLPTIQNVRRPKV